MSWASKFVFDPIKAAIARAAQSSNPVAQQTAAAASAAVNQIASDTTSTALSSNSAAGLASTIVGDLENGLNDTVSTLVGALVGDIPVVGSFISPQAKEQTKTALIFAEQHAMSYLAALFAHHHDQANATPVVASGGMKPIPNP